MNIQEYISSGIVESYVLGLASSHERDEFERMCAAHNEVRAAREEFEMQFENYSLKNAVKAPAQVRSKLFAEIEIDQQNAAPVSKTISANSSKLTTRNTVAPVVTIKPWWRYVAAASVILLLTSTALNVYFFSQFKTTEQLYKSVLSKNEVLVNNEKAIEASFKEYQQAIDKLRDPAMALVRMHGAEVPTSPDSNSMATVYWDTRTKDVFLQINNMPTPTPDLQYQLWAIVDGVPVDAGVFDFNSTKPLVAMKNIPRAQAFAITLEKKGGSPIPKGQMYVLGKVS